MLKQLSIAALALLCAAVCAAQLSFGPAFDKTNVTPVAQVLANPAEYAGKTITVAGKVQAVCKKQGCWMTLTTAEDVPGFKIKVRDGEMVFPLSSMGKQALAHGVVQAMPMDLNASIEYLAHLAHEQGEAFDPASVTEAITLYQLVPTSVEIAQ